MIDDQTVPESARIRRAEAMLGIYYHAYQGHDGFELPPKLGPLPLFLQPISLEAAADVLGQTNDDHALLRRRRAIATLVESGLNSRPDFESLVKSIFPAIEQEQLEALLQPNLSPNSVYTLFGPGPCVCQNVTRDLRRRADYPLIVDATVSAEVNRTFKPVCESMDPQNWAKCSDFFANVYPARATNGEYPGSGETDPPRGPSPGPPGTAWSAICFEHFWAPWGGLATAWFRNFLDIRTVMKSAQEFEVQYLLKRAIGSRVGVHQQDGGLDIDSGSILIEQIAGGATTRCPQSFSSSTPPLSRPTPRVWRSPAPSTRSWRSRAS